MNEERKTFVGALELIAGIETFDRVLGDVEFGVYIDQPEQGCVFANERLLSLFGLTWEEFAGYGWAKAVHPDDAGGLQEKVFEFEHDKEALEHVFRIRRPSGEERWVESRARAVTATDGKHLGSIALVVDVTEKQSLRERSVTAQKLEAVGQLAGRVAHDFNNLLTAVVMSVSIVKELVKGNEGREAVAIIEQAVEHATALTGQMLLLSSHRIQSSSTCLLDAELRKLGSLLSRTLGERIELAMQLEAGEAIVPLARSELGQVVVNLATNARDAIEGCGRIEFVTYAGESHAHIEVKDDGAGMSAEILARVQEPFFTTKPPGKGTGLGLATSSDIIMRAGGMLDIESSEGNGTRCSVKLPLSTGTTGDRVVEKPVVLTNLRLLLVEDDDALRQSFALALSTRGMSVDIARDLAAAREHLERGDYDAIICDVLLPDGSSVGLVEEIREQQPNLRVVFVSGYAGEDAERITGDNYTRFLGKPFGPAELLRIVSELLNSR